MDAEQYLKTEGVDGLDADLTPPEIIGDINASPALARYKDEIIDGALAQIHLAEAEQYRIRQASDRLEKYHMDGIGGRVASIHPTIFKVLGMVYGRNWFRTRKMLHYVLNRHPELQMRCGLRRFTLRVNGLRDQGLGTRGERGHATRGEPAGPMAQERERAPGVRDRTTAGPSRTGEDGRARARSGHGTAGAPRIPGQRDGPSRTGIIAAPAAKEPDSRRLEVACA